MKIIAWLYFGVALWLALYGLNAMILTAIAIKHSFQQRLAKRSLPGHEQPTHWPRVTVQLPMFNEPHVVSRLIDAAAQLDYPNKLLQIQVLDDSTDETTDLAAARVAFWRQRGRHIDLVHREKRTDFKAGALRDGMAEADGEFIAIFDADFVPPPQWLKAALLPMLQPDGEGIGLVQTRWGHLNSGFSPLTRAQTLALDGHFGVEQAGRAAGGMLFNFNGSAGLWRRAAIEGAGGWRSLTLTEDLDLSYRAQFAGWRLHYERDIEAPAEIPVAMVAFKKQQFRWAKGSIQCARLLARDLLYGGLGRWRTFQAFVHLTGYVIHPLMVVLLLLTLPLTIWGLPVLRQLPLSMLSVAGLGAPLLYFVAQLSIATHEPRWRRLVWLPALVLLGTGIALSNSKAVLEGLFGRESAFERTPKTGMTRHGQGWQAARSEALPVDWLSWGELFLSLYAFAAIVCAWWAGDIGAIPFLAVYAFGFAWVGGMTLWQQRAGQSRRSTVRSRHRSSRSPL